MIFGREGEWSFARLDSRLRGNDDHLRGNENTKPVLVRRRIAARNRETMLGEVAETRKEVETGEAS